MLAHIALVLREYPPSLLLRGEIPLRGDVWHYFATAHGGSQVQGVFGYDPCFMAGYPVGLWNSVGNKAYSVIHSLAPFIPLPALFYLTITGVALLAPLVAWFGLRPLFPDRRRWTLLLLVLLLYWHLDTQIAYFWGFGNVFFPAAACLVPVLVASVWNALSGRSWALLAPAAGLVAGLIFYTHPAAFVAGLVPVAAAAVLNGKRSACPGYWLAMGTAAAVFVAVAAWWLIPLLRNLGDCVPRPEKFFESNWRNLVMDVFSDRVYRHPFDRTFLYHVAVVLGVGGSILCWRANRALSVMGVGGLACLVFAYSGSSLGPLAALQPYRFVLPGAVLLLAPMTECLVWIARVVKESSWRIRVAALLVALILLPEFAGYLLDRAGRRGGTELSGARWEALRMIDRLPLQGRILCDDVQLGRVTPYFTGKPVIGGLGQAAFVKHGFASMWDDRLFGREVGRWTGSDLALYFRHYAVEYALFARSEWKELARRNEALFVLEKESAGYNLFRVLGAEPSLVLSGKAVVRADYDRIDVSQVQTNILVLKLHYASWLAADRGVNLEPERVLDDPVPFMRCRVPEGVNEFVIRKK
ncbi:MAG: hypothetical protein QME60_01535 [Verrucomicrobiota bacterium]|nr:hypothetical protein [Verrucomicrobiota bacterium]